MNQHNGLSRRSPEEIEREIAHTRTEIEDTLGELQRDLTLGHIAERTLAYVSESGSDVMHAVTRTVTRTVRNNPMPAAVIGLGVAWLVMSAGRRRAEPARRYAGEEYVHEEEELVGYEPVHEEDGERREARERARATAARARMRAEGVRERAGERLESAKESTKERLGSARERAGERLGSAKEKAKEKTRGMMDSAKEKATGAMSTAKGRASEMTSRATSRAKQGARRVGSEVRYQGARGRSQLKERFSEQPMLLAFLGLAVGALLGALLPSTRQEARLLGPARERFVSRADEIAARQIRETGQAVERSIETTAQAAEEAARESKGTAQEELRRDAEGRPGAPGTTT